MDPREYIDVRFDMVPPYEEKVLSREGETEIIQRANGVISKALITARPRACARAWTNTSASR